LDISRAADPVAVGDDVRRHPRAVRPVPPVDVLDHLLALVARGEVKVDVGHSPRSSERKRSKRSSIFTGSIAVMERA